MIDKKHLENKNIYKISLHIGFWSLVFLWPLLSAEEFSGIKHIVNRNWLSTFCLFLVFYINYFILIDKYFFKNKKLMFYLLNIVLLVGVLFVAQYFQKFDLFNPSINGVRLREMRSSNISSLQLVISMVLSVGMCLGLKINKKWSQNEMLLQKTKQAQLNSEIENLKYQIQPHFLFNTLNNIYSLIDDSPDIAKTSLHSLSKMMRYLLHDSSTIRVPLTKEISFLEKFIDLMQLRFSSNLKVEKSFPIINQPIQIAPLLLITFIENAFKHGIDAVHPSHIKIKMTIENEKIYYLVTNSAFPQNEELTDSGIGLENLQKRLELLYPNRYELIQEKKDDLYISKLILKFKNDD